LKRTLNISAVVILLAGRSAAAVTPSKAIPRASAVAMAEAVAECRQLLIVLSLDTNVPFGVGRRGWLSLERRRLWRVERKLRLVRSRMHRRLTTAGWSRVASI
jgi:hypothetical protein